MARPKKVIDPEQVKKLAAIQCSHAEMASVLGCSSDTLERRFAAVIKEGRAIGRTSLKRWQYMAAEKGNITMMIWLGKQYLGQSDKNEVENKIVDNTKETKEKLIEHARMLINAK